MSAVFDPQAAHARPRDKAPAAARRTAGPRPEDRLVRALGNAVVQAKLGVSAPGDAAEQEADRVADRVVANGPAPAAGPSGDAGSGGRPLDGGTRAFMESSFGRDFSGVRVHTDAAAARAAQDAHALAYTVGSHIFFGASMFAPATPAGRRLLAHELTHVVQQAGAGDRSLQRQKAPEVEQGFVIEGSWGGRGLPVLGGYELEKELLRRGILKPGDYDTWGWLDNGYYFSRSEGAGPTFHVYRVLDAIQLRNDAGEVIGVRVISYLHGPAQGGSAAAPPKPEKGAPRKAESKKAESKKADSKNVEPKTTKKPEPKTEPKTAEQLQAEFEALPDAVRELLAGDEPVGQAELPQLLRIAAKLRRLAPEDLQLYRLLAKRLAADLDAFEQSVDVFVRFKDRVRAQAAAERKSTEETLEQKLAKTWRGFDEKSFAGMDTAQKEDLARKIAAEQRNIQLEHLATHPGETAVGMVESMVRLDRTAKSIVDDVREAADGDNGAYQRLAGATGAVNKYVAAVASIAFVALLFVPGVNLLELAAAGLAVAAASIALSTAEAALRIKAAGEARNPEDFKAQTGKSAAAQTQAVMAAAMLALTLVAKIVARIPLPGRLRNVGTALRGAQTALLEKSGVGPAWRSVKADLVAGLRAAKQGLSEALAVRTKEVAATANAVAGMTGEEFVRHLADADPRLADVGIPVEQAKATQQLASTPEGKGIPERLRQDALQALQEAPAEAARKVDRFVTAVDDSIAKVEQAAGPEQLRSAVEEADRRLGAGEQARQAVADDEAFLTRRAKGARRSGIREQAREKLAALQEEKLRTQGEIDRLEAELSAANRKVDTLRKKALDTPAGSPARAHATRELNEAREALAELREADELGGYREERARQKKTEEAVLQSLELKRPALRQSFKDRVKSAGKKNAKGQYLDANTGEAIDGEPVYGHIYGREHRRLVLEASEKGMTQEQFNDWVNDHPEWFQLETKANNESHRFEKPGVD
jgi:uncharacterized protein DUF4157/HNH/ENDO VII superfamily nuclease